MGKVKQVTFPVQIQGDGSTSTWTVNLTETPFNLGGSSILSVAIADPTGTYTPAGILNGTIPGILALAVGAAIPNGTVWTFYITCTVAMS
jgi:hypothetical protein